MGSFKVIIETQMKGEWLSHIKLPSFYFVQVGAVCYSIMF